MFRNNLRVALRSLRRSPWYTFINASGLALGLACCVLILLFVYDELKYDRHHENADRIYRVTASYTEGSHWAPIGPPVGPAMKAAIPEITAVARFHPFGGSDIFQFEDNIFEERLGVLADSSVFDVLSIALLQGNPQRALVAPYTVVISASMAEKYFGGANPLGKSFRVNDRYELEVTGVMEDLPATTHLPFQFMVSMSSFYQWSENDPDQMLTWAGFYTYVQVREGAELNLVENKIGNFAGTFFKDVFDEPAQEVVTFHLQPITRIHLHSALEKEYRANSNAIYVYVFGLVAIFVLLIACVNFTILTTARAGKRMQEVGIRKTLGSIRKQLAFQFLGESLLLSGLALMGAYVLVVVGIPVLNEITGKSIAMDPSLHLLIWAGLLVATLAAGLLSGSYPALYLSGLSPIRALKGETIPGAERSFMRRGLVAFQFGVSIFLIASTLVVARQLSYFRSMQLGFEQEGVIVMQLNGALRDYVFDGNLDNFKEELVRHSSIRQVSLASDVPGQRYSLEYFYVDGSQDQVDETIMRVAWGVDHDYVKALGITLVEGRDFSKRAPADTSAWIVNEAAVRRLGLEAPVGQILRWGDRYAGPIVGVAADFNFASLHHEVEPLVIPLRPGIGGNVVVRVSTSDVDGALGHAREVIEAVAPGALFTFDFLSDELDALYRSERRLARVFGYFSSLAILIACMGLIGLAAYTAERRSKEIGIRKVLGASVSNVLILLSMEFARLVGLGFLVAVPMCYLFMSRWLQSFAYQIELNAGVFVLAGLAVLGVAMVTISYQSVRAALADPVKSLRYE